MLGHHSVLHRYRLAHAQARLLLLHQYHVPREIFGDHEVGEKRRAAPVAQYGYRLNRMEEGGGLPRGVRAPQSQQRKQLVFNYVCSNSKLEHIIF